MNLTLTKEQVPLKTDSDGVVRVGGTRVTLDTIVASFKDGATAEEIVYRYPTLHLADVYAVISYYLRRPKEVELYLRQRQKSTGKIRRQNETRFDLSGVRDRLIARQAERKRKKDAAIGR